MKSKSLFEFFKCYLINKTIIKEDRFVLFFFWNFLSSTLKFLVEIGIFLVQSSLLEDILQKKTKNSCPAVWNVFIFDYHFIQMMFCLILALSASIFFFKMRLWIRRQNSLKIRSFISTLFLSVCKKNLF